MQIDGDYVKLYFSKYVYFTLDFATLYKRQECDMQQDARMILSNKNHSSA